MPRVIHKFTIFDDNRSIEMPKGAQILSAQEQHGEVQIWAMVDTEAPKEQRNFRVIGTGVITKMYMDETAIFIDTVQLLGGRLVLHVFETTGGAK